MAARHPRGGRRRDRLNVYRSSRVSHEAYARMALRQVADGRRHAFVEACAALGVQPSEREAGLWRSGLGRVLEEAWRQWPKSKHLPARREAER